MKRVLLTGVGGFVGSHCLKYFLQNTDWHIIGLDSFRHKGTYTRLSEFDVDWSRVKIFKHDLTVPLDVELENKIQGRRVSGGKVEEEPIDIIINMASDSAVERSVSDPGSCWRNNCELAYNMLEFARKIKPELFITISSDEVYGDCAEKYSHHEWDIILPSNVYSASKAAQEALSIAYWRSYDVPVIITNCMNLIGAWQDKEKFLPKLIWKIATGQVMEVYGDPQSDGSHKIGSRFYLHCENKADALIFLSKRKPAMYKDGARMPDRFNIVGEVEMDNLAMAKLVADIMGKELKYRIVPSESARRGYDRRYALNGTAMKLLGWKPPVEFRQGVENIVEWTLKHPWWLAYPTEG